MSAPTEALTDDSQCPACGDVGIWREEADVGIGILYGPYGCQCGWSEDSEYDCREGRKDAPASSPGWQADPWGGITSDERVAENNAFFDFLEHVAAGGASS